MTGTDAVDLRPLSRADLPLLARWLAEPLVRRWWHHDSGIRTLERDFGPAIDGPDPTEIHLTGVDGVWFGLIQRYLIDDNPEYADELATVCEVPPGALSVDYLIGEPACRGRGLASRMIAASVRDARIRHPEAAVVVPVHVANVASWRSLENAGFDRIAAGALTPDNPADSTDHYVYCLRP